MRSLYLTAEQNRRIDFVFVSRWFMEEVAMRDTRCKPKNWHIIPNYVDESRFPYQQKVPEQRLHILSLRSFDSRKYANDLVVNAIAELSQLSFFEQLSFLIMGEGRLYEATVAPLQKYPNVRLRRQFLPQDEISSLHTQHGIFLCPTRLDAQGVSMCEAMSSGLVPVTNKVSAIPEFVSDQEGILARKNNHVDLARGIQHIYENPDDFLQKSYHAAKRVCSQCGFQATLQREMVLITA